MMIRKSWFVAVGVLCCVTAGWAQDGLARARAAGRSEITVAVDGLNCSTSIGTGSFTALAWSFGASQPETTASGSGALTGKANLTSLNVTKRADSCSPALFGDVVTGKVMKSLTLVQQDHAKDDVFTLTLSNVIVSAYQLSGEQSSEIPSEQVSFTFSKICVSDSQTGTKFCWDSSTGKSL